MKRIIVKNGLVWQEGRFIPGDVLCEDGIILAVGQGLGLENAEILSGEGFHIIPGIIDAHTHGAVHVDVNAAGVDGLRKLSAFFASQGVTAFQASILTDQDSVVNQCLRDVQQVMRDKGAGAQLLGAHLEGPFLSREYKGAMPESLLREGDPELLEGWLNAFPGVVRYVTVSPEVRGVPEMIRRFKRDVVFAIGHSGADYATAMEAIQAGARCITHTFNAMRLFHQHEPAIMGAALESDCWCEAICDGRHLAPGTVRMLLKCKGPHRVMGVTDSIMAAGLPDGKYKLGVNDVTVKDGDARLTDSGVRAGSTLTGIQGLRNVMKFTGKSLEEVVPLFTVNPAQALRIENRKGSLAPGKDGDFLLLDGENQVAATLVRGEMVYRRAEAG